MPHRSRTSAAVLTLALIISQCGCGKSTPSRTRAVEGGIVMLSVPTDPHRVGLQQAHQGTGWVYSAPNGLIVTAFHVVADAPFVQVNVGPRAAQPALVVAASPC